MAETVPPTAGQPRGLADVIAASTAVSDIDGRAGLLSYRGYDIHDLAGAISFEECVHLLQRGSLPTVRELGALRTELDEGRAVGPTAEAVLELPGVRGAPPMEALRTLVSALSADDPDAQSNAPEANQRKAIRLVAQLPALVARYQAARTGSPLPDADPALGVAGNFLLQITGKVPDPTAVSSFDECLVLHADHTMNASTFAARVCAATLSDMHSAVTAAIGTLKGPLHGGANEGVIQMLEEIGSEENVDAYIEKQLAEKRKIMGIGHRVYKTLDPRAPHLQRMAVKLSEKLGDAKWIRMSERIAQLMKERKNLNANVDFYSATVYYSLGIPTDLFTPIFAVARTSGWCAHILEQLEDNRLFRPLSEYIGEPVGKKVVPIDERG